MNLQTQRSNDAFDLDERSNLALAKKCWVEEVKGGNTLCSAPDG